ncbi:O-antigen ligase family protein [Patescibacteria group bacterium]|nr:O-antigen ligase family protein [Patescibacteria group bacterium]
MDDLDSLTSLRKILNTYSSLIFKAGVVLTVLAAFFLFTNLFTEIYDTPKILILSIFTALMLLFLTLRFAFSGKAVFVRTPLDIPLLLLMAVAVVSTILSPSPYVALLGNQLKIHGSLVSIVIYVLFYFVLVNSFKSIKDIQWIFNLILPAALILAVVSLLSYAGVKILPEPWAQTANFTPTGSPFSTTAVLALLVPVVVMQIFSSSKPLFIILNSLFLLIFGAAIALTGNWATWIGALLGLVLTVFAISPIRQISRIRPISLMGLIGPICLIGLITILSFVPPLGKAKNPLYTLSQNFPREIQLGFVSSWKISASAFRDSPFWGTGPATFAFNFTNYKPLEFNSTKLWNLRFDSAFNEYLQVLSALGGIGVLAFLSLTALFVSAAYKSYMSYMSDRSDPEKERLTLAVSGLVFFVMLALHPSTLVLWIVGILILAAYMTLTTGNSSTETPRRSTIPGILLILSIASVLFAGYFGGKITLADYHHRLALNAVAQNQGIVAYNELVAAEKLNPWSDLYRTDLAQTNFALANSIAAAKGPSEASPSGSLTDQDKQNIQVLLQQSINEGRIATNLSPRSTVNWEILALLYRQISGVAQNALTFSLDSYGRAIEQDPLNPILRVNVGGVYYAAQNYDMAIRFFTDAVNLKPDYANAYYNLSVALKDKGDLEGAIAAAENTLPLVDSDSADYKTLNDYLADLKKTSQSEIEPPAAADSSALQEKGLPKVVDVGTPPAKIATPEAIEK